jgi:hypothetical protein
LNADTGHCWMNLLHPFLHLVMAYYIFLKEHECILPMLWLVFTFFAIVVDGLPQIVHSWNFIFLFNWLSQFCGDIFQLCLPTLLIETHCRWFLYQFVSLVFSINLYTVPCLMNGCHLNWSSFFMPAVVPPGLTCHHYIWTCCHCSCLICIL